MFACCTSASRKAVPPVFERRQSLLLYPTHCEGFECSKFKDQGPAIGSR